MLTCLSHSSCPEHTHIELNLNDKNYNYNHFNYYFSSNESDNDKEIVNQTIMIKWNKNKKPL